MIKICLCSSNYKCQLCRQEIILTKIDKIKSKLNELENSKFYQAIKSYSIHTKKND